MIVPIIGGIEGDCDQGHAILLRGGNQTSAAFFGKSRFDTDTSVVHPQKLIMIVQDADIGDVRMWYGHLSGGDDLAKLGILESALRDARKIVCGGIVRRVVKSVRIDKVRAF